MDMDEWGDFIECVAESVIDELNESHPGFNDLEIKDLIRLCYIYILERDIIARAHYNCYGCQQEAPGQRDHMENGCLADWEDLVHQYYPEAVMAFSRPLFAELCRSVINYFSFKFRKKNERLHHSKIHVHLFSALIKAIGKHREPALLILLDIYQRTRAATEEELITTVIPDNIRTKLFDIYTKI